MNTEVEILTAGPQDAIEIARLSYQVGKMHDEAMPDYFKPTVETEHLRIVNEMMNDKKIKMFKAVCREQICGFLCLFIPEAQRNGFVHSQTGYVYNLGVDEAYRGNGVGTALMKAAEDFLVGKGIYAMEMNVFMFNTGALNFYAKQGYKKIDVNLYKVLK